MGSAYVLLHHVMGSLDEKGSWFYVRGGNGALTEYFADKAKERGVDILLNSPVEKILFDENYSKASGVQLSNGIKIKAKNVITNCDLNSTYFNLMSDRDRSNILKDNQEFSLSQIDYTSPVFKINLIVDKLPQFKCLSEKVGGNFDSKEYEAIAREYLTGTVHINSDSIDKLDFSYQEAVQGIPSTKPLIEMTIPSILDGSLAPKGSGHHVIGLFCQYAPKLKEGRWNEEKKQEFAQKVYKEIEQFCPGFSESILFEDLLSSEDLEKEFSIKGGNIFHGSIELKSFFFCRPFLHFSDYRQNLKNINNLFSCSSGMHPGGGVMGAPGRN
eukprot:CAMPEP_0170525992 /NCGR_PEP_ID=MMETSP0209-20121228/11453_1 /TAXON_ID=665100 ORGANISM="Litonotus pictus, Strain P1" /NCGR_SAMPLE_ID=MMETSP0209 /ASSEMBLY_ACC=CAM_ASM_000301 /LENGTH=327 /DNA_ID=CAMNT_0010815577 /DNA_START=198 /DNA_END=1178 /DNA_ORIENTATION=-